FLMKNGRFGLDAWLKQQGYKEADFVKWKKYELDAGDAFSDTSELKNARIMGIAGFIKDAYGIPYVPGISIKGMIRTALLAYEIKRKQNEFTDIKAQIVRNSGKKENPNKYLSRETESLEIKAFHTLKKVVENTKNAVNCNLSGLIVSDSNPISAEHLTLSQKIDYTLDRQEKKLPILREVLAPGTEICFELSIDQTQCPYTISEIMDALNEFQKTSYQYFYSRFGRGIKGENIVWLGGGCGFLSKSIIYPLFGEDAPEIADNIFKITLGKKYTIHKHNRNASLRLAPHVCKCTRYRGELYDMGMGRIEVVQS
ncbi:MAG: type III-A CRISPR-associated RAMP protein Csm5, partial [Lachnospiraceae bacterium]|nr:type III-A CRISPR-associated RAMP protein Csm5 [Lachnospiraceae bacterium]